jgi:FdhE protein
LTSGDCPICGTPASNSRVLDEGELQGGQRILSCPLCRAEWDYQRIRCARCGNRSHDSLHYLFDERDPGHRIHVCESCHGYIKVSVERDLDVSVVPQVEDVVTLALDDLAGSKGYSALGDEPSAEE